MKPANKSKRPDPTPAGRPWPLGVEWVGAENAFNFALYSRHATGVTLLCYDETDPAKAFEQRWASTVLHTVLQRLRNEFVESGRSELFEALHAHLWGDDESVPYPHLAKDFNLSVANVKTTAHRLRRRYQQLLREEIAQTISQPGEIDEEIRYLMMVVSR